MNREIALARKSEKAYENTFPFEGIPGQSKLFIDFLKNSKDIQKFYPSKNTDLKQLSKDVLANYEVERDVLCDILKAENEELSAGSYTLGSIEKLRDEDCVAVVAGQQAGLFSGAMYTIYKAISAIKLAKDLTDQGIKAVPLFWVASEDHDLEEANETFAMDQTGGIETIANELFEIEAGTPVEFVNLGEQVGATIDSYFAALPTTDFSTQTRSLLEGVYQAEATFGSAFARLMLELFGRHGLILVSPMNKDLRKLCAPIFGEAIRKHEQITDRLRQRDLELADLGYHSQVLVSEDFFPFFHIDKKRKRNALRFDKENRKITSLGTEDVFTKEDLLKIAMDTPEQLSPNALMRPVIQDYLFPTVSFYGGSAEVAYFAQNEVIYETLGRPVNQIRHRASFTVIEPKSKRTLDRYRLDFEDMFLNEEDLLGKVIDEFVAGDTANTFENVERSIKEQLSRLEKQLLSSEPTLADNLANRRKKILWHIETLKKKFHKAELLKNEVLKRRIHFVKSSLCPRNSLQERTINIFYYLNAYGPNFIDWVYNAVDLDEKEHQLLIL